MSEAWNAVWSWLTSTIGDVLAGDPAWRLPVGAALIGVGAALLALVELRRRSARREAQRRARREAWGAAWEPTVTAPAPSSQRVVAIPTLAPWSAPEHAPVIPALRAPYGASPDRPYPLSQPPRNASANVPAYPSGGLGNPGMVVARAPEPVLAAPTSPLSAGGSGPLRATADGDGRSLARPPATPSRPADWRTIYQGQPTAPLAGVATTATEARPSATTDPLVPIASGPQRIADTLAVAERAPSALPLRQETEPWGNARTAAVSVPATAPDADDARADALYRQGHELANRTEGNVAQALRDALTAYRGAEGIWTRERAPERWAALQSDIGRVYQEIPDGDRAANLRTAILCYERALEVFEPVRHAINWAWTQSALGVAYQSLPIGSPVANARAAVAYHQRALDVFTPENCPLAWAWNMNNLGTAYEAIHGGPEGGMVAQLHEAERCYEAALDVYTADRHPVRHQVVARNLARVQTELRALE